jgi:HSP20 family protein
MNCTNTETFLRPAASIIENAEGYIIEADMPGVARDGIELNVENDVLTIRGKRAESPVNGNGRALHRESPSRNYRRAFQLTREIDRSRVTAKFEQGVLQVYLPKSEALKPRRVEVAG